MKPTPTQRPSSTSRLERRGMRDKVDRRLATRVHEQ
jgi:hypothetical protein